ncbi:hypothetical protein F2P56_013842 [Juglans regia]|uniref:Reverse transcriptase zinc-binding domain-containing protein n=1 Tax=Juglans regia TaxID=51240 RepID=A0A833XC18_JUGRE|nr:hypothetical protein F2P56_013842 [Juglans regia]
MVDGKRILFWHDLWCGNTVLKLEFPALFRIARDQNAAVCDLYCSSNNKVEWNVIFNRDVNDWEVDEVKALLVKLYSSKLVEDREDCMVWIPAGNAKFSVSSYYRILSSHSSCVFPWKSIWKVKVPSKVAFFRWVASLGKVLTTENLRRRGLFIADWCVLCKRDGESVNHLFVHCKVTRFLWNEVLSWTGLHWVMPREVVDLLVGWKGVKGCKKAMSVWKMIPPCLMWCIWLERNGRCFEDRECSLGDLRVFFLSTLSSWAKTFVMADNFLHLF